MAHGSWLMAHGSWLMALIKIVNDDDSFLGSYDGLKMERSLPIGDRV
jgi:hypothetical protein